MAGAGLGEIPEFGTGALAAGVPSCAEENRKAHTRVVSFAVSHSNNTVDVSQSNNPFDVSQSKNTFDVKGRNNAALSPHHNRLVHCECRFNPGCSKLCPLSFHQARQTSAWHEGHAMVPSPCPPGLTRPVPFARGAVPALAVLAVSAVAAGASHRRFFGVGGLTCSPSDGLLAVETWARPSLPCPSAILLCSGAAAPRWTRCPLLSLALSLHAQRSRQLIRHTILT